MKKPPPLLLLIQYYRRPSISALIIWDLCEKFNIVTMPVIVLEAKDFSSPLFLVRTWEILSGCTTFSLVASLQPSELYKNASNLPHLHTFRIFCMFTWCFFFTLTLLIHILSIIQFHSLIPISWKNLTVTAAVFGALMCLSASVVFPWIIMDHQQVSPRPVSAAVASCITFLAYTSESYVLGTQALEQRGYMGTVPGFLKILQLWGGCQTIPLLLETVSGPPNGVPSWQLVVSGVSYGACVLIFLAGFSLIGVLLYMVATVICFTKILQLRDISQSIPNKIVELVIMETVVVSITISPPEHDGHVKLDSAVGRCNSQAGLNGTEDTSGRFVTCPPRAS
ncbi:hypothetical protein FQN60_011616, partial [Etheostoma spectabile]